jgi:Cu(I)/Ag(I) efflux system membrane fusion protein
VDRGLSGSPVPGVPGNASALVPAARRRLALWDVPDAEIEELLKTGEVRRTLTVRSPLSGIVIEKPVMRGQAVQAGQTLYTVADLSRVWVEAELRESDAGALREGTPASVELGAFPGRVLQGRVDYVYPTVQQQARTLKARVTLSNPDGLLKPGMYATVRLATPSRTALTVPSAAVVDTGVRRIVFVDLGGGRLVPQEVTTGQVAGDLTEIVSGLFPGQRVVTSAQYLLDAESNLGEVMRSMIGQGGGDMGGMEMGGKGADTKGMPGMDMPPKGR